ncbi:hypothetical protein J1N09_11820 [Aureitalea sp. L0-47]|uniref:hypothetical protein n=1 Tax=Aureitalea sp. L0-47 TaxID=2816962 RepID=UPI002237A47F|nr:hypothetical protein [Aureitalea sp. L0-47]MCW5520533.1 hypothetical protein [Aureitalea sp. L0-47]
MRTNITLFALVTILLFSCSPENEDFVQNDAVENFEIIIIDGGVTGDPTATTCTETTDLIAGQNTVVGTVDITYDPANDTYTITYTTENGWELEETHLWVGDCANRPANNPGNPLIGQFPFSESHTGGTTTFTYTIDGANLNTIGCLAAHASVDGPNGENETAWGNGLPYGGNSWAMYFEYDFSECQ